MTTKSRIQGVISKLLNYKTPTSSSFCGSAVDHEAALESAHSLNSKAVILNVGGSNDFVCRNML